MSVTQLFTSCGNDGSSSRQELPKPITRTIGSRFCDFPTIGGAFYASNLRQPELTPDHMKELPVLKYQPTAHGKNSLQIWGVLVLTALVWAITVLHYKLPAKNKISIV